MRWWDRMQVRTAVWFTLASVVPLAALAAILHGQVVAGLESAASRANRALVEGVRSDVEARLSFAGEQFERLAEAPPVQSLRRDRQEDEVRRFLGLHPVFFKAMTFDATGRILSVVFRSHYRGEDALVGTPVAAHDPLLAAAVADAVASGATKYTSPTVDAFSQAILYVVTPVRHFVHDDRVVGAAAGGVQLYGHQFQDLIDRARLPAGGFALIADPDGAVLAGRGEGLPRRLGRFRLLTVRGVVDALAGEREYLEGRVIVHGRDMLAAVAPLTGTGLRLVVGRPWDAVRGPAAAVALRMLGFTAAGVVFSVVLGLFLARSFVRPLAELVAGIRVVATGTLSHRVPVTRADELGQAAAAFNDLAAELEKRRLVEEIWSREWDAP